MDINGSIAKELEIRKEQAEAAIRLLDEGCTVPFIARYRKEVTGELSDEVLRNLFDRLTYLRNINEKREEIKRLIDEQGNLTPELTEAIDKASTITELDDIYRPFRPKRQSDQPKTPSRFLKTRARLQPKDVPIFSPSYKESPSTVLHHPTKPNRSLADDLR